MSEYDDMSLSEYDDMSLSEYDDMSPCPNMMACHYARI